MKTESTSKNILIVIFIVLAVVGLIFIINNKTDMAQTSDQKSPVKGSSAPSEEDIAKIKDVFVKIRNEGKSDITSIERDDLKTSMRYVVSFGRTPETYQIQEKVVKLSEATVVLEIKRGASIGQIYFKVHKESRPEIAENSFALLMQILTQGANIEWVPVYRAEIPRSVPEDYNYHPIGSNLATVIPYAAITNDGHEES